MSLFSTIAHDGPVPVRGVRPKNMALIVIAAAVAIGIGLVSLSLRPDVTDSAMGTTTGQLTHAEFIDLNTVALEGLAPKSPPVADNSFAVADNSFLYWNVSALEGLNPAIKADRVDSNLRDFLYWNIESIEYHSPVYAESALGPR